MMLPVLLTLLLLAIVTKDEVAAVYCAIAASEESGYPASALEDANAWNDEYEPTGALVTSDAELETVEEVDEVMAAAAADDAVGNDDPEDTWAGTTSLLSKGRQVPGSGCSSEKSVISKRGSSSPLKGVWASRIRSMP